MAALFQVLAVALLFAYASSRLYREPELWQDDYVSEISDQSDTDVLDDPDILALLAAEDEEDEDDSEDEDDDPLEHFVDVLRKLKHEDGIDEDVISLLLSELEGEDEVEEHESEAESEEEQVAREPRREKRSPARSSSRSSSSRSRGSGWLSRRSSSSSSSSSSGSSSSSRSSGGWFRRSSSSGSSSRSGSSSSSSSGSSSSSSGSSSSTGTSSTGGGSYGWNTGNNRGTATGASGAGVATGVSTGTSGTRPGGYPSGTVPHSGYPTGSQPASGYPTGTQPGAGYPGNTRPVVGYPSGNQPVPGYPTGTQPGAGYPGNTRPVAGYPSSNQPVPGYPTGTQPGVGYPGNTRPVAGYPSGPQPVPGYPGGTRPFGGYPGYPGSTGFSTGYGYGGYPAAGYSAGGYSSGGYATGFPAAGYAAGGFAGYPAGGFPMPKRKKSKKEKVKEVVNKAVTGYLAHKAAKKNKFLNPSHIHGFGHGRGGGFHGMGGKFGAGALGGLAVGKTAKTLLGAYMKIKIAKYALKFGAEAAKAYFQYKLHRDLDDYTINKFIHRYHQQRVSRFGRRRYHNNHREKPEAAANITLGEFCYRPCMPNDTRICQFTFEVHLYQTLSRACYKCPSNATDCDRPECVAGDGTRRMVTAVNKGIPGPSIQVCVGDKVLVDVLNDMPSTAVTLHWHGLTMGPSFAVPRAEKTPFMDGTPGITQCPVGPSSGFRYSFIASNPGTHFWHAQTGLERGDGVFGPLIVHQSHENDPYQKLAQHIMTINDWFHSSTQSKYVLRQHSNQEAKPQSILINGRGPQKHDADEVARVPYSKFIVANDTRYRMRVINAAVTNCPVTVTVDSHDFVLLAADGSLVSPMNTTSLLIYPGERYDVLIAAEQQTSSDGGVFWVRVQGGNDCGHLQQYAILQYLPTNFSFAEAPPTVPPKTTPTPKTPPAPGSQDFSGACGTEGQRCVSGLRSPTDLPASLQVAKANVTLYLAFTSKQIHNENFYSILLYDIYEETDPSKRLATPQINHLSFRAPPIPLLVNHRPLKSENCSSEGVRRGHCTADFCECLHVLQAPIGAIVDLVLIGEGPANGTSQAVHLHGFKFWVLSQVAAEDVPAPTMTTTTTTTTPSPSADSEDSVDIPPAGDEYLSRDKVMQLDAEGKLKRYVLDPVAKDTVTIPPGGYTVVRIVAENPGFWMLESQVLFNAMAGQSLILQVGNTADFPKPAKDFPTC